MRRRSVDQKKKKRSLNIELSQFGLHVTGLILLAAGCLSQVLRRRWFDDLGGAMDSQLLEALDRGFGLATVTVICQVAELMAIPIFAFLLTEGAMRTSSFKKYLLRVAALALVCEVPYSLLWNGEIFVAWSHNIVFGSLMALAMLWFFKSFPEKTGGHLAIRILAGVGAFIWCNFLGLVHGGVTVLLAAVFWFTKGKANIQILAGLGACLVCAALSPLYFICAAGLIAVHLYSGKKGRESKLVTYLSYPVMLLIFFFFLFL